MFSCLVWQCDPSLLCSAMIKFRINLLNSATYVWLVMKLLFYADCHGALGVVDPANLKVILCEGFKIECAHRDHRQRW